MKHEGLTALLQILADGQVHSGTALGESLGLTRAAVWKQIRQLLESFPGLEIEQLPGRGYRLSGALELLCPNRIRQLLADSGGNLANLAVLPSIESTNDHLMQSAAFLPGHAEVCLAEQQTSGRGRRGRRWISPFGRNIYLSFAWRFDRPLAVMSGLALAVAVGLTEMLEAAGARPLELKWPNDILSAGRKLAGILIEARGESGGPIEVVIGVGLNFGMAERQARDIDQPWTEVISLLDQAPSRNWMVARLIDTLLRVCPSYERQGLEPFLQEWRRYDVLPGQSVVLQLPGETIQGEYLGIDAVGALLLQTASGQRRFHSGEISLRRAN